MIKTIISSDPGKGGAIAWGQIGKIVGPVDCSPMPATEQGVADLLESIVLNRPPGEIVAYMELVGGFIRQAKNEEERENRQPAHQMFQFGRTVGVVVGALRALKVENLVEVHPLVWQKPLFLQTRGKPYSERKRMLLMEARRHYPNPKTTARTADALLIYRYAVMVESQNLFRR